MTLNGRVLFLHSKRFLTGITIAVSAVLATQPVSAADQVERCRNYANKAVQQNAMNEKLNCGYRDKRWSDSRKAHVKWCKMVAGNAGELRKQSRERELLLDKCRKGEKKTDKSKTEGEGRNRKRVDDEQITNRCRNYADTAVKQQAAAKRNKCGFDGRRWKGDRKHHVQWCRSVGGNVGEIKTQTKERANMIANCKTRN